MYVQAVCLSISYIYIHVTIYYCIVLYASTWSYIENNRDMPHAITRHSIRFPSFLVLCDPEFWTRNHKGHQRGHGVGGGINHEAASHQELACNWIFTWIMFFCFFSPSYLWWQQTSHNFGSLIWSLGACPLTSCYPWHRTFLSGTSCRSCRLCITFSGAELAQLTASISKYGSRQKKYSTHQKQGLNGLECFFCEQLALY